MDGWLYSLVSCTRSGLFDDHSAYVLITDKKPMDLIDGFGKHHGHCGF